MTASTLTSARTRTPCYMTGARTASYGMSARRLHRSCTRGLVAGPVRHLPEFIPDLLRVAPHDLLQGDLPLGVRFHEVGSDIGIIEQVLVVAISGGEENLADPRPIGSGIAHRTWLAA